MQFFTISLLLPIAYLGILVGSLAAFSHLYRRRQLVAKLRLAPYFDTHVTRNVYLSLLHLPDTSDEKQKVPDSVLRAALLARACTDVERIMDIRTRKPALTQLLQRGVVGEEMMQRLTRAEQELEIEIKDVVTEANALGPPQGNFPGWGQVIFQSAGEMVQNKLLREKIEKIQDPTVLAAEKASWDQVREGARRELMDGKPVDDNAPPISAPSQERKPSILAKSGSSDEDAVLVDKNGSDESRPNTSSGGAKKKKKNKNKALSQPQPEPQAVV